MNWIPSRLAYAGATLSALFALLPTEPAHGHLDVRPRLVEPDTVTEMRIELPQLRAGPAPVRLDVEANGVAVLASTLQGVTGAETLWNVRLRVSPDVPQGELPLVLRAYFADGESVGVDGGVVVVPRAEEASDTFPWLWVAAGITLALGFVVPALVHARRRPQGRSSC